MAQLARPDPAAWDFRSIYGGHYEAADFAGRAVLLVNTASHCGCTPQYGGLQRLQNLYGDRGLVVLAVPSDDFEQEEPDDGAVRAFCERTYGITLKMAGITPVTGAAAHPLYLWLAEAGVRPEWNFNKVLFDRDGGVAGTWGSDDEPLGGDIEAAVQRTLAMDDGETGSP